MPIESEKLPNKDEKQQAKQDMLKESVWILYEKERVYKKNSV